MDLELTGVHVLLTGASGGIGIATAELFLEQGAILTAQYNSDPRGLKDLVGKYGEHRIRLAQCELSSESAVLSLFDDIAKAPLGAVDALVPNHGYHVSHSVPLASMDLEQWQYALDANLTSSFLLARSYLRQLCSAKRQDNASIIFVGSTAGKIGEAGHADYAACKSALMYGLTLSLKNEIIKIAPKGRVNSVAPGWTITPKKIAEGVLTKDPESTYKAMATIPLKKFGAPEDIARQIVLTTSSRASGHISGQVLVVDGGMEGRLLNSQEDVQL